MDVSQKIRDWTPRSRELDDVRWVERPEWACRAFSAGEIVGMNEREVVRKDESNTEEIGKPLIQWEFSTATLKSWALLLATILEQLGLAIDATKEARENNLTDKETVGLNEVHRWCYCLFAYVYWKEGVIKTLLTKTSLAHAFNLRSVIWKIGGTQILSFSFIHLVKYPQKT